MKNLHLFRLFIIAASLLFLNDLQSQCTITYGTTNDWTDGNYIFGQGFTATCSGPIDSLGFVAAFDGTLAGDILEIFEGNTVSGTPVYSQAFSSFTVTAGDVLLISLDNVFNVVQGNQYTFQHRVNGIHVLTLSPADPYTGGSVFQYGIEHSSSSGLKFKVFVEGEAVSVFDKENNYQIKLYPNPTNGLLFVETEEVEVVNYSVNDWSGKTLVKSTTYNDKIDLQHLPTGIYNVSLRDKDQNVLVNKKVVKVN